MIVEFTPANELERRSFAPPPIRRRAPDFYRRLLAAELYVLTEDAPLEDGQTSKPRGRPTRR